MSERMVVVINVVGLTLEHLEKHQDRIPHLSALLEQGKLFKMLPVFPAVTLPVQASLTSGVYPDEHGILSNGFYFPEQFQVAFWEQAASLVQNERIWDRLKKRNPELKTALLFLQNSLYADCNAIMTPKPLHTETGLIQWCYSKPVGLYEAISEDIGDFNLMHYWGPMASIESSRWIAKAAVETIARIKPDLLFVYLPHLDYCSQKFGPEDAMVYAELTEIDREVGRIIGGIEALGMRDKCVFAVLSEYAFSKVDGDIPINRLLREKGLLEIRMIKGREYLDIELSPAFAMVDHQVAHVYVKPGRRKAVRAALESVDGIDILMDTEGKKSHRIDHVRAGDFVVVSARDRWFSYYWWDDRSKEPDFATKVDIHRKPGFDPMELFFEPGTFQISQDTSLVRGSHGYPPLAERDLVPFLVSGDLRARSGMPETLKAVDVPVMLEAILFDEY
jgi:predicted AlkP superfamily pyrophosphatase or phosphodiesterase